MNTAPLRLLLVEDSADDAELALAVLREAGHHPSAQRVETEDGMRAALAQGPWDLVLSDFNLPDFSAGAALALLHAAGSSAPFIVVSGLVGEEAAVALIKAGAADFVAKDNLQQLAAAADRALREAEVSRQHAGAVLALQESETRFKAITMNLPGVVFQVVCTPDNRIKTTYVSDGCKALCGLPAPVIVARPEAFIEMIVAEDRIGYHRSRLRSHKTRRSQNWEGRIRLPGSDQIKWINLRSSIRSLPSGETVFEGIISNITQSKAVEIELLRSREALRELSSHLQHVKEEERTHISREIHDELGGTLTAAKIDLLNLVQQLPEGALDLLSKAGSIEVLLDQAMDITRRVARRLRPGVLDHGIAAAIEWQAKDFEKRLGIRCAFSCTDEDLRLPPEMSTALFRMLQETLTNVAKHAEAENVHISLDDDGERIVLDVSDDGRGIAEADMHKTGSFGMQGMRERAQYFGGGLRVSAAPEGGTRVRVWVRSPLRPRLTPELLQSDLFR